MGSTVTGVPKEGYLHIALDGVWGRSSFAETADKILALCEKHQAHKVLMDVRGLNGTPTTLERFTMATVFTAKYLKARLTHRIPPCRFSVIGNHPIVDHNRFEETVAVNRGLPVRTFTDLEKALDWLEVEKTPAGRP